MTIRQLEKRCDREIQAVCEQYTMPKLQEKAIEIWKKYAELIEAARAEEPAIANLEGYGRFLANLATEALKNGGSHERPILDDGLRGELNRANMGAAIRRATNEGNRESNQNSDSNQPIMEGL